MKWVLPGNQFFENKVRYLPVREYYDKTIQNGVRHRISSYKVILIDITIMNKTMENNKNSPNNKTGQFYKDE